MRIITLLLLLSFYGCKKDKSCEKCPPQNGSTNAVVQWTGPVAGDGCDWCIVTDGNERFHADNLTAAFKQDQLRVQITYTLTSDKFYCGLAASAMPVIHLRTIKK